MRIKAWCEFKAQKCILKYFCTLANSAQMPDLCRLSRDAGREAPHHDTNMQYKGHTWEYTIKSNM